MSTTGISASAFADLMAELPAGVAVITTRGPEGPLGLLVTSLSGYTAEPPSVLVSIADSSRSYPSLLAAERFGVHLLHNGQEPIARVFASRGDDKFAELDWTWDGDVPRINGAHAYMRCRRDAQFEHLDHAVLIGLIEEVEHEGASEPMLYLRRRFAWRFR